jgi:hypothetical protein
VIVRIQGAEIRIQNGPMWIPNFNHDDTRTRRECREFEYVYRSEFQNFRMMLGDGARFLGFLLDGMYLQSKVCVAVVNLRPWFS